MNYSHGYRKHPLYSVWRNVKTRCYNPKTHNYSNYGGKGIVVCAEWLDDPKAFIDWCLANGYRPDMTLDREDPNGNYEPSNCRWTSYEIQSRNKGKYKNGSSKYIGVTSQFWGGRTMWLANIRVNGENKYLGSFVTEYNAAMTRDKFIIDNKLNGYRLNLQ